MKQNRRKEGNSNHQAQTRKEIKFNCSSDRVSSAVTQQFVSWGLIYSITNMVVMNWRVGEAVETWKHVEFIRTVSPHFPAFLQLVGQI